MYKQPPFNRITEAALAAYHRTEIHPSDWASMANWWEKAYGITPTDSQLAVLSKQLNDRAKR